VRKYSFSGGRPGKLAVQATPSRVSSSEHVSVSCHIPTGAIVGVGVENGVGVCVDGPEAAAVGSGVPDEGSSKVGVGV